MDSIRFSPNSPNKFKQVVIWGYPLHSHTHSYIHAAFVKAFKHLGWPTHWLSDGDDISGMDFDNTLFFIAGDDRQKDTPVNATSTYVVHNTDGRPFLKAGAKVLVLQVYGNDLAAARKHSNGAHGYEELNAYTYTFQGKKVMSLHQPWATDLLPHEINVGQYPFDTAYEDKYCLWVGTYGANDGEFETDSNIMPYMRAAEDAGIRLHMQSPWSKPISFEENRQLVHDAYLAPALQGKWQVKNQYIPCRIFKNISYGNIGITLSERVNEVFDNQLVYDPDPVALFHKSIAERENFDTNKMDHLMNEVKEKHTFVHRIQQIMECLPE